MTLGESRRRGAPRSISSTRQARLARRHAHALIDWRADVLRGARIGRTASRVDLPRRFRLNDRWVLIHLFRWDENRHVKAFRAEWDASGDPYDLLTEGHDDRQL